MAKTLHDMIVTARSRDVDGDGVPSVEHVPPDCDLNWTLKLSEHTNYPGCDRAKLSCDAVPTALWTEVKNHVHNCEPGGDTDKTFYQITMVLTSSDLTKPTTADVSSLVQYDDYPDASPVFREHTGKSVTVPTTFWDALVDCIEAKEGI
jgi:hypothetical protein